MDTPFFIKKELQYTTVINLLVMLLAEMSETNYKLRSDFCERYGIDFDESEKEYLKARSASIKQIYNVLFEEYGDIESLIEMPVEMQEPVNKAQATEIKKTSLFVNVARMFQALKKKH